MTRGGEKVINSVAETAREFNRLAVYPAPVWDHNSSYHSWLLQYVPRPCRLALDVGCGSGAFTRLLARVAERVVAIDVSPAMISLARERSRDARNIEYICADFNDFELPNAAFDYAVSIATMHHLPLQAAVPHLRAALRPQGTLAIIDLLSDATLAGKARSVAAKAWSTLLELRHNGLYRASPAARAAWREHGSHDSYLSFGEARDFFVSSLPGARIRRRLFWRYSVLWEKCSS